MRKIFYFVIVLILVAIAVVPFVFGYLFENKFKQQVAYLQQSHNSDGIQVKLESYQRGWFQSKAMISVTQTISSKEFGAGIPPLIYYIDSEISHGPFVFANGSFVTAYAYLESILHLPDMIRIFIPERGHGFMQIYSQLGFDGSTWSNHYNVQSMDFFSVVTWDGLTGDIIFFTDNYRPIKVLNKMIIGKFVARSFGSSSDVSTFEPVMYSLDVSKDANDIWSGSSETSTDGFNAKYIVDSGLNMKNLLFKSSYGSSGNAYHYLTEIHVDSLKLPVKSPVSIVSDVKYSLGVNNIDVAGLKKVKDNAGLDFYPGAKSYSFNHYSDSILDLLMSGSNLDSKLNFGTNLGNFSADLNLKMLAKPKTTVSILDNLSGIFNARVSQQLLTAVLQYYFSKPSYPINYNSYMGNENSNKIDAKEVGAKSDAALSAQINTLLNNFVQSGLLVIDKNDYVIAITKDGPRLNLNGKQIDNVEEIRKQVWDGYHELYGNQCYWMNSQNGKNTWVLFAGTRMDNCYSYDSCSRGMARSGGGCYKWAASPNSQPEPWNADIKGSPLEKSVPANNNIVFKANTAKNTVSVCTRKEDGTLDACVGFTSATFSAPTDIVINPSRTIINIMNSGNQTNSVCTINGNGGLYACEIGAAPQAPVPAATLVTPATPLAPTSGNYTFYQGMDSGGNDITQRVDLIGNVNKLKEYCDSLSNCKGFNTSGWLKSVILPNNQWWHFSNNPNDGLYVKKSDAVQNNITSKPQVRKSMMQ